MDGGLLRGTLRYTDKDSVAHILAYGAAGVWRTDTAASAFADFNEGLSQGADYRSMKGIVQTPDGTLYAAGQFGLYRHDGTAWIEIPLPLDEGERLSDITVRGDTLVVADVVPLSLHVFSRRISENTGESSRRLRAEGDAFPHGVDVA